MTEHATSLSLSNLIGWPLAYLHLSLPTSLCGDRSFRHIKKKTKCHARSYLPLQAKSVREAVATQEQNL